MVKVTGDPWITPVGGVTVGITGGVLATTTIAIVVLSRSTVFVGYSNDQINRAERLE